MRRNAGDYRGTGGKHRIDHRLDEREHERGHAADVDDRGPPDGLDDSDRYDGAEESAGHAGDHRFGGGDGEHFEARGAERLNQGYFSPAPYSHEQQGRRHRYQCDGQRPYFRVFRGVRYRAMVEAIASAYPSASTATRC